MIKISERSIKRVFVRLNTDSYNNQDEMTPRDRSNKGEERSAKRGKDENGGNKQASEDELQRTYLAVNLNLRVWAVLRVRDKIILESSRRDTPAPSIVNLTTQHSSIVCLQHATHSKANRPFDCVVTLHT